jgi:hypothetical protein
LGSTPRKYLVLHYFLKLWVLWDGRRGDNKVAERVVLSLRGEMVVSGHNGRFATQNGSKLPLAGEIYHSFTLMLPPMRGYRIDFLELSASVRQP